MARPRRSTPAAPAAPPPRRSRFRPLAFIAAIVIAGAALWLWPRRSAFELPRADANTNVLLVTIDTLRGDALSSYGGPARTPNLDTLAARGARFTFAHAHAVVTLPSHVSILTGHLPYEHGVRDNPGFRVADGTVTLATRLKAAGFATGAFIGGFPLTKRFGLAPGFDVYDDQIPEMQSAEVFSMPERPADTVVGRALDWIGKQSGKFFEWVHVFDPHAPYRPPQEYLSAYPAQPYYGEVAFADHALGPLFDRLASLSRPTLVVVTADHGESLGEHGEQTHGMFAYESTLHVPLIIARVDPASHAKAAGAVVDAPVRHIDLVPTILDAAGLPTDASLPGVSLRDVIRTDRMESHPSYFEALSFNLTRGWAPLRGILVERSKYIDLPIPELYELSSDPKETRNLAPTDPARVGSLLAALRAQNTTAPNRPGRESAQTSAALRSLGYVSGSAAPRSTYTEEDDPKRLAEVDHDLHVAQDLYERGKPDDAIPILTRVLARQPKMADAYVYLAYVYWDTGRPALAISTLEGAIKSGVTDRDVRIKLALYLSQTGADPKRAIALLEGLASDDVEALNSLGAAYAAAGRSADAIRTFKSILALDPTNGLALQNVASVQLADALAIRDPQDARRLTGLKDAETSVRAALAADPNLPDGYTTLGVILARTGRKPEAIDAWKQAVRLDSRALDALYNLTIELLAAGRPDEARSFGQQYLATAPPALYQAEINEIRRLLGGTMH
jgi:arylsulfatase A-like enzyme/Tfp pilus assembly protein PilF